MEKPIWKEEFEEKFCDKGLVIKEYVRQLSPSQQVAVKAFISSLLERVIEDIPNDACDITDNGCNMLPLKQQLRAKYIK
jgi:hypothetical protein